eukprot:scaffold170147_cov50-Prasinocladus_malaysianus.AAC.1
MHLHEAAVTSCIRTRLKSSVVLPANIGPVINSILPVSAGGLSGALLFERTPAASLLCATASMSPARLYELNL